MTGKKIRLERILDRKTGKTIIVPMDHGVTVGPIEGLKNLSKTVDAVANGGANAVIGHVGLPLHGHRHSGKDVGLILHLSASTSLTPDPNNKVLVNTVERAIKMGADGVSIHVNVGAKMSQYAKRLWHYFKSVYGMGNASFSHDVCPCSNQKETSLEVVQHAARVGSELGAI